MTRKGFTLIELLVVLVIILLVSAVALPVVIPAVSHRQVSEAARIFQAGLASARDSAIHSGHPAGIRLLPDPSVLSYYVPPGGTTQQVDPTKALAANRFIPLEPAPDYNAGMVSVISDPPPPAVSPFPNGTTYPYPPGTVTNPVTGFAISVLMVEQCPVITSGPNAGLLNETTSWFWNIRVGEKITIGNSTQQYTVIGPLTVGPSGGNTELFVNDGPPGATPQLSRTYATPGGPLTTAVEYLFVVNGQDDDSDGFIDDEWDGVDQNFNNIIDDWPAEWTENEKWLGSLASLPALNGVVTGPNLTLSTPGLTNLPYTIQRNPVPSSKGREIAFPSNVVIDLTSWGNGQLNIGPPERSRVPTQAFNIYTGAIDILVYPDGSLVPTTLYSSPASFGLAGSFLHFWLGERSDVVAPNGNTAPPTLPIGTILPTQNGTAVPPAITRLKGEYRLVTLFSRTGQITTNDTVFFDNPANPLAGPSGAYNPNVPYLSAQQGLSGGQ